MRQAGFTMVELMVVVGLMAVVATLTVVAVSTSAETAAVSDANTVVQANLRDTLREMAGELQFASRREDTSLQPPLRPLRVVNNPVPESPVEVVFQVPLDDTGLNWSRPVRYRYMGDSGGDGVPARRILRMQDVDGDGSTGGPGEIRVVGAANAIDDVVFALNPAGDILTISVTSARPVAGRRGSRVEETLTTRIHLVN